VKEIHWTVKALRDLRKIKDQKEQEKIYLFAGGKTPTVKGGDESPAIRAMPLNGL
jgi:hypothetical protein